MKKCIYCDFPSYVGVNKFIPSYVDALCREIISSPIRGEEADTIYFGGGTPSLLSPFQIEKILHALQQRFCITDHPEITLEANPDNMNKEYASALCSLGINRISIGIQSFDDMIIRHLGRSHTAAEGMQAVTNAYNSGVHNISVDLMYGLPYQHLKDVNKSLSVLAALPVVHASIYSLIVEEHTMLSDALRRETLQLPDKDTVDNMGQMIRDHMSDKGFEHYEISSYSRSEYRSRHNSKYWKYVPYIGFGVSAHSFYDNERFANTANMPSYIKNAGYHDVCTERIRIDRQRAVEDYCILALRMRDGIDYADFRTRFSCDIEKEFDHVLDILFHDKLLEKTPTGCRLSSLGFDYGNYVFGHFIRD